MQLKAKRRAILRSKDKGEVEFSTMEAENPTFGNEVTEHSVERGQDVADHVKPLPNEYSLQGVIVGPDAAEKLDKLLQFRKEGTLLTYIGRNATSQVVIENLSTEHSTQIANGLSFTLTLKQVRIANSTEVKIKLPEAKPVSNVGRQQPAGQKSEKPEIYLIKRGDTLWALSRRFGCTVEDWLKANPKIKNRDLIYAGDTLVVPK